MKILIWIFTISVSINAVLLIGWAVAESERKDLEWCIQKQAQYVNSDGVPHRRSGFWSVVRRLQDKDAMPWEITEAKKRLHEYRMRAH